MRLNRKNVIAGTVGTLLLGTIMPGASASPPSNLSIATLATGTLNQPLQVKNDGVRLRSKAATDIRVQTITFTAGGGKTGWHHHPGLVVVVVESGAVTVWETDCTSTTYGPKEAAGAVFTEGGDESQEVTSNGGRVYATFVVPHADPAVFRIEDPARSCT